MGNLLICGRCGWDGNTEEGRTLNKIILGRHANILCNVCEDEMNDAMEQLSVQFLTTRAKSLLNLEKKEKVK